MNSRIQYYKLWRHISIAMMVAVAVVVMAVDFVSSPSHETNSSLTKICNYKGIRFCLVMPAEGYTSLTRSSHSAETTEGLT